MGAYDKPFGLFLFIHLISTQSLICPSPCHSPFFSYTNFPSMKFSGFLPMFAGNKKQLSGLCFPFFLQWGHSGRLLPFLRPRHLSLVVVFVISWGAPPRVSISSRPEYAGALAAGDVVGVAANAVGCNTLALGKIGCYCPQGGTLYGCPVDLVLW
jgi:hypothetical protein